MRHSINTQTWLKELRDLFSAEKDEPRARKKLLTIQVQICEELLELVNPCSVTNESQQRKVQRRIEDYAATGNNPVEPTHLKRERHEDFLFSLATYLNSCKQSA
ncbi:MAG TPA: hypothetical protein VEA92_02375 [Candidatus Paceibacterota bacterium]|nr:hypothetical protein [Candidatus Paceibacterota bacterium]